MYYSRVILIFHMLIFLQYCKGQHDFIPSHLMECYEEGVLLAPMSITTLIEIIRKIELNNYFSMDIRLLTNAILNRFWLDGIERNPNVALNQPGIFPYRTSGFQIHRYNLLYSRLIPNGGAWFPNETLTLSERCTLHFMLSNSIDVWERGDEMHFCPTSSYQKQWNYFEPTGVKRSSCPIEKGVVEAHFYGTVSPSRIFTAIAATLQPLSVPQYLLFNSEAVGRLSMDFQSNKTVNSLWASTFSGDLAEILVFQMPISKVPRIGPGGFWNDSIVPANYYMITDSDSVLHSYWQFTDSEILGAIDGFIIGTEVDKWNRITGTLRLSQILEMFYSNRGGDFPNQLRVCHRRDFFTGAINKQIEVIIDQTINFAELLATYAPSYLAKDNFIVTESPVVFHSFKSYTNRILQKFPGCTQDVLITRSKIFLTVIYDATWNGYRMLKFLTKIGELIDVSQYGSNITIINGVTGSAIVSAVDSIYELYLSWQSSSPNLKKTEASELSKGFLTLQRLVESDLYQNRRRSFIASSTLVLGLSTTLSDVMLSEITSSVESVKSFSPEMKIIYVTRNENRMSYLPLIHPQFVPQKDVLISIPDAAEEKLLSELKFLNDLPRHMIPSNCEVQQDTFPRRRREITFDDYLSPSKSHKFALNPTYFCASDNVTFTFQNANYGVLQVCASRVDPIVNSLADCRVANEFETITFVYDQPCQTKSSKTFRTTKTCQPIYLTTYSKRSQNRCTENSCRFPNQVRYSVTVQGTHCSQSYANVCSKSSEKIVIEKIYLTIIVLNIFFRNI